MSAPVEDAKSRLAAVEAECDRLREEAHTAPRSVPGGFQSAWSSSSRHWMEACDRRDALRKLMGVA